MRISTDRTINAKASELARQGWLVVRGGRHWRMVHPTTGYVLTVPGRPGDHRTVHNWMAQLRRAERVGFDSREIFRRDR
jgi:predicted RNA binding protein YcfA (HicA-like mRNA interferase family)